MKQLRGRESRRAFQHLKLDAAGPAIGKRANGRKRKTMSDILSAVTDANFEKDVIEASKTQPVLVDFWADWCRPCHMLTPTVEEIARENAGKLKVVKLNVDENINAAGKFNIRGIPTLLVFKGGQVADQLVGAQPKETIVKVLQRHLS
jgi:thioredoxin 1